MKQALHFLAAAVLFFASTSAHAMFFLTQLTPDHIREGDLAFDITTEKMADGAIDFHVTISDKGVRFRSHISTTLGVVEITENSRRVSVERVLSHERKAGSLVCVFSVTKASLDDPLLCFVLNVEQDVYIYAKLKDFIDPKPAAPAVLATGKPPAAPLRDAERTQIRRLADLGFGWDQKELSATVGQGKDGRADVATIAKAVPSLRALGCKRLDFSSCKELQNVDGLKELTTLTDLDLSNCESLGNVDGLIGLTELASLDLRRCKKLRNLDGLKNLSKLATLCLSECDGLQSVDALMDLKALTTLDLSHCSNLQNVNGLKDHAAVTRLDLSHCGNLRDVSGLKGLTAIASLDLAGCTQLHNIDDLKGLNALNGLVLSDCENLENVDALKALPLLYDLSLSNCNKLRNFDALKSLTKLVRLVLSHCENLPDVDSLKGMAELTDLYLSQCKNLQNVNGLKGLITLTSLHLSDCQNLRSVAGLKGLNSIETLESRRSPNSFGIKYSSMKSRSFTVALLFLSAMVIPHRAKAPPRFSRNVFVPGTPLGKTESYWLAPYVQVLKQRVGGHAMETVTWFAEDGSVKKQIASPESVVYGSPGYLVCTIEDGHRIVHGVNDEWKLPLTDLCHVTTDSRTLFVPFHSGDGNISVDVYVHGIFTNTLGPYVQHQPEFLALGA